MQDWPGPSINLSGEMRSQMQLVRRNIEQDRGTQHTRTEQSWFFNQKANFLSVRQKMGAHVARNPLFWVWPRWLKGSVYASSVPPFDELNPSISCTGHSPRSAAGYRDWITTIHGPRLCIPHSSRLWAGVPSRRVWRRCHVIKLGRGEVEDDVSGFDIDSEMSKCAIFVSQSFGYGRQGSDVMAARCRLIQLCSCWKITKTEQREFWKTSKQHTRENSRLVHDFVLSDFS